MFDKIRILFTFLLMAIGLNLFAQPVSLQESENVAKNWMLLKTGKHFSVQKTLAPTNEVKNSSDQAQTRIIKLSPNAWVVVSGDDVVQPILGYGESSMDLSSQPPGFKDWIANADLQIKAGLKQSTQTSTATQSNAKKQKIADEWKRLKVDTKTFIDQDLQNRKPTSTVTSSTIQPLLWMGGGSETSGIIWDQSPYYNAKCPFDSRDVSGHAVVGCTATAMSQIMRYYQSPTWGTGSFSYVDPTYGTQYADFGSTSYQWSSMPYQLTNNSSSSEIDAVAILSYHAGVSIETEYGWSWDGAQGGPGSAAIPEAVPNALKNYFGYIESDIYYRNDNLSGWDGWLQAELSASRPLFYAGFNSNGGHAFVLDGYDGSGYYHFNWGWAGSSNGYYSLDNLTPGGNNFTYDQKAVKIVASSAPTPPKPPKPTPSQVTETEVTELYVATFLRAPDAGGLNYWVYDSGLGIQGIASSFFLQPETQAKYPPDTLIGDFVNTVYQNLFNRYPGQAGYDYWVDALYYETIPPSLFILAVINGAQGEDAIIMDNKTRVGEHYANSGQTDPWCAEYVMWYIDETEQSVQDAFNYINNGC
ncbi:MAG: hypothetical protein DRG30_03745 [Epsilonproteobacteria bacterium]|nr:MAG: hypothetical protein DRG30_03745 [Campylobacterota bacterium]